jgi:hypothetical protein
MSNRPEEEALNSGMASKMDKMNDGKPTNIPEGERKRGYSMSDEEALGIPPKKESAYPYGAAPMDNSCQKRAYELNLRSENGKAEKEGGY